MGRPVALRATDWATPLVTAVLMVLVGRAVPADTVAEVGEADIEKSLGGGGAVELALNRAMPSDQYWMAGIAAREALGCRGGEDLVAALDRHRFGLVVSAGVGACSPAT